ncbi:MAG TPA: hypothetical protein VM260_10500 [Pirellula sp.]|nr:hypothetical protein [Pirellula sp.]
METCNRESDVNELLARMQKVRASGYNHAGELHGEAKRLVDWKEYVRSKPLLSVAVASLVGFSLVRSAVGTNSHATHARASSNNSLENLNSSQSSQSSWKSGAMGFVSNLASIALKHYLTSFLQPRNTEGGFNDRFRNTGSKEASIGSPT